MRPPFEKALIYLEILGSKQMFWGASKLQKGRDIMEKSICHLQQLPKTELQKAKRLEIQNQNPQAWIYYWLFHSIIERNSVTLLPWKLHHSTHIYFCSCWHARKISSKGKYVWEWHQLLREQLRELSPRSLASLLMVLRLMGVVPWCYNTTIFHPHRLFYILDTQLHTSVYNIK